MLERELIPQTIELLRDAFTIRNEMNEYSCLRMMEFFIDEMKFLEVDIQFIAYEIAHQKAENILQPMKQFDFKTVQKIEQMLIYI
ncbi:hypothetical protein ABE26_21475 [Cytobacillus firmus]|nr:hypothetical protein [Cytobacillus firmus]